MKILIAVLLLSFLSGCATVDKASYPNIEFGKDDQVNRVDFRHKDVPEREVTIEHCVEKHVANEDIDIKDRSTALGFILAGPALIGLAIGDDEEVVKASDLILESSPSRVKAAGRIRHSKDSINPETLGFLLTVSETERGMLYRYENPQRLFDIQAKGLLPEYASGWIPLTTKNANSFYTIYSLMEDSADHLQECLIQDT